MYYDIKIPSSRVIAWMNVLRKYKDQEQYRVLENFWESQVKSKVWIVNTLKELQIISSGNAYVFGGWYGLMASMLIDNFDFCKVYSIDQDSKCRFIGEELDNHESLKPRINFVTSNMEDFVFEETSTTVVKSVPSVIINTSTEHLTDEIFNRWLTNMPEGVPIVLQGNNLNIEEHIRSSKNLSEFKEQNKLGHILWEGELDCKTFTRYMIIGTKK